MSSLTQTKAAEMQIYIRNHWSIENSCNWVMNTVFEKDEIQISKRNVAKKFSTKRTMALNSLKQAPEISKRKKPASLSRKQHKAAHDSQYREQCLGLTPYCNRCSGFEFVAFHSRHLKLTSSLAPIYFF